MNEHIGKWKTQEVNLLITMKYSYAKIRLTATQHDVELLWEPCQIC